MPAPSSERRASRAPSTRLATLVAFAWIGLVPAYGIADDGAKSASRTARADFAREVVVDAVSADSAFHSRWGKSAVVSGGDRGATWIRATTLGDGNPDLVARRHSYDPPVDFTNRFLKVRLKVEDLSRLSGMEFRLSSDGLAGAYFAFAVPLFEDEAFNFMHADEWVTLTFSFGSAAVTGKPDRARIDSFGWLLRDRGKGPEAPVVAHLGGVWAVDEPPTGVVSFTFDDGYDEHYRVGAKAMAKYGYPGTAYVMPDQIGLEGYMTLRELKSLQRDYGWDVAAHHLEPFTDVDPVLLEATVRNIKGFLRDNGFAKGADHVAYPLGKQNPETVLPIMRRHFRSARIAASGPETLPPADPHRLRVLNVVADTTLPQIRRAVSQANANHEWLILMFHYLVDDPDTYTHFSIRDFEQVVEIVHEQGVEVLPVSAVLDRIPGS